MIYIIKNTGNTHIKIGYSNEPIQRINTLQTAHSTILELLYVEEGDITKEKSIHKILKKKLLRNEWYDFTDIETELKTIFPNFNYYTAIPIDTYILKNGESVFSENPFIPVNGEIIKTANKIFRHKERVWFHNTSDEDIIINTLSPLAKSIFIWLLRNINFDNDYVEFNIKFYSDTFIVQTWDLEDAFAEIIDHKILTQSNLEDIYWFNPNFFLLHNNVDEFKNKILEKLRK